MAGPSPGHGTPRCFESRGPALLSGTAAKVAGELTACRAARGADEDNLMLGIVSGYDLLALESTPGRLDDTIGIFPPIGRSAPPRPAPGPLSSSSNCMIWQCGRSPFRLAPPRPALRRNYRVFLLPGISWLNPALGVPSLRIGCATWAAGVNSCTVATPRRCGRTSTRCRTRCATRGGSPWARPCMRPSL